MKLWLSLMVLGLLSNQALASDWKVNNSQSTVSFISIKKADVGEVHRFKQIEGALSDSGGFSLTIDLSSVDSGISVRDDRMQGLLFEVAQFPKLQLTANINPKLISDLKVGETLTTQVDATVALHGEQQVLPFNVVVAKLSATKMLVTSLMPVVVQAGDFNLVSGVEKLRDIAGLTSISLAVPVSFVLTLSQ
ncbi:YceI family protein [Shewanella glacialimarina]|uniref:YceI family protein n=1 Tax=Shewanella glacialimarina TaxID=2590884 RepID=UPI001CF8FBF7|nr:YceI family protein [Shewanella glacialimarina]UCX04977.1 YceI family protein [Shewanella glacialimarina]